MIAAAAFIILLGPGSREYRRFLDLTASLAHFEKEFLRECALVVVNDTGLGLARIVDGGALGFRDVVVLENPYTGRADGAIVYDRLSAGLLIALRQVCEMGGLKFVMKVDTDALACGAFAGRVASFFRLHPRVGMIGSLHHNPDGSPRSVEHWWAKQIRGTCGPLPHKLFSLHRKHNLPLRFPVTLVRWSRRSHLLRRAVRNGWSCGDNVLGGAYALSSLVIDTLRERVDLLRDSFLFHGTRIPEDVMMSLLVPAMGYELGEFNRPGEVFGIWYQKPTLSMETLVERGYGLIHSIKAVDPIEEQAMRDSIAASLGFRKENGDSALPLTHARARL